MVEQVRSKNDIFMANLKKRYLQLYASNSQYFFWNNHRYALTERCTSVPCRKIHNEHSQPETVPSLAGHSPAEVPHKASRQRRSYLKTLQEPQFPLHRNKVNSGHRLSLQLRTISPVSFTTAPPPDLKCSFRRKKELSTTPQPSRTCSFCRKEEWSTTPKPNRTCSFRCNEESSGSILTRKRFETSIDRAKPPGEVKKIYKADNKNRKVGASRRRLSLAADLNCAISCSITNDLSPSLPVTKEPYIPFADPFKLPSSLKPIGAEQSKSSKGPFSRPPTPFSPFQSSDTEERKLKQHRKKEHSEPRSERPHSTRGLLDDSIMRNKLHRNVSRGTGLTRSASAGQCEGYRGKILNRHSRIKESKASTGLYEYTMDRNFRIALANSIDVGPYVGSLARRDKRRRPDVKRDSFQHKAKDFSPPPRMSKDSGSKGKASGAEFMSKTRDFTSRTRDSAALSSSANSLESQGLKRSHTVCASGSGDIHSYLRSKCSRDIASSRDDGISFKRHSKSTFDSGFESGLSDILDEILGGANYDPVLEESASPKTKWQSFKGKLIEAFAKSKKSELNDSGSDSSEVKATKWDKLQQFVKVKVAKVSHQDLDMGGFEDAHWRTLEPRQFHRGTRKTQSFVKWNRGGSR